MGVGHGNGDGDKKSSPRIRLEILFLMGGNDDRWMVEILSSYRMDFALFRQGVSAIPDRDWLRFVTKEANKVFMKGQEKLSSLKQLISSPN